MAELTAQKIAPEGTSITYDPATGTGDTYTPSSGREEFRMANGDTVSHTVTIAVNRDVVGLAVPNRQVTVAAGGEKSIPLLKDLYSDANGVISFTYDAVTAVTVAVVDPY